MVHEYGDGSSTPEGNLMENHIKWPDGVETIEVDGVAAEVIEYMDNDRVRVLIMETQTEDIWQLEAV